MLCSLQEEKETGSRTNQSQGGEAEKKAGKGRLTTVHLINLLFLTLFSLSMQALKKMEKKDRLPKPLVECEIPIQLHQERSERLRGIEVSPEEREARVLHMKEWARHCYVR